MTFSVIGISPETGSLTVALLPANPAYQPRTLPLHEAAICFRQTPALPANACTFSVSAPPGTSEYRLTAYASADGSGSPIAAGTTLTTVVATSAPPHVVVALGAVITRLQFDRPRSVLAADGAAHVLSLRLVAQDAAGDAALAPDAFYHNVRTPIDGDTDGAFVVAANAAGADAATVTLDVDTAKSWIAATVGADAPGIPAARATIVSLRTSPRNLALIAGGASATLTVAEDGTAGPFTASTSNQQLVTLDSSASAAQAGGNASFTVVPGSAGGTATLRFTDPSGTATTVAVVVTPQTGGSISIPGAPQLDRYTAGINAGAALGAITRGADGRLWFGEGSAIGSGTTAGVVTTTTMGITSSDIRGITAGPDGNVWFVEPDTAAVASITPGGTVTEYYQLDFPSAPDGIATGSDGALWIAESAVDAIVRFSPVIGQRTGTYPVAAGAAPAAIAPGPDGGLWFTEPGLNHIGRLTTEGTLTEFGGGITAGAGLTGIVAGSDGNLWFTEGPAGRIGRITPAGVVTEFARGITAGAAPAQIAAGSDGNLWFTEPGTGTLGRITPAGVVAEFPLGGGGTPAGITRGPDGAIWLTTTAPAALVRVHP